MSIIESKKYSMADIYEMLGGTDYFSLDEIYFVFYSLNENVLLAAEYLKKCIKSNQDVVNNFAHFKTKEQLDYLKTIDENEEI